MEFLEHGNEKAIASLKKTDENWHSVMVKLEFQRTQNPTLHAPIPIWGLDSRVVAHQRICLDWDLATRLENRKSAVWGRRNRGDRRTVVAYFGTSVNDVPHFST
ncbi:hypothetical protein AVEN_110349-1 [Araneus ventricosus]|uniref:Uncharacterized protein n=1 Tax=Araneus ventricosus TaxID=182803 RepID=A0A4Y2EKN9_ARAVE|nr:hypothetical protein AVEN_110349-1 [Araneus ventricosus]